MTNCKLITIVLIVLLLVFSYYMYKASNFEHMSSTCHGSIIKTTNGSYCKYTDEQCKKLGCFKATPSRPGMDNMCLC